MKKEDFEQLKDFILSKNSYFNNGYANAYMDAEKGVVVSNGVDMQRIFPLDNTGSYCYLRNETAIKHELKTTERLTDNSAQKLVFNDVITCYLVAVVRDADVYIVLENLKNTVLQYTGVSVLPVSSTWNGEQVIREELQFAGKGAITSALQRLKNETIVKLTLQVSKPFIPGNCINDI